MDRIGHHRTDPPLTVPHRRRRQGGGKTYRRPVAAFAAAFAATCPAFPAVPAVPEPPKPAAAALHRRGTVGSGCGEYETHELL